MKYKVPKGTRDILPQEISRWQRVEHLFAEICGEFGYKEIRIPTFEQTEVFARGVGETTDVVQKEMYTFPDKGGRSLTLRPEGTAGVVRSFIENGMASYTSPVRLFYNITAFRYENVQKGRYREFHQFGLEAFGAEGPQIDAEIISVLVLFFSKAGLKEIQLRLNSIGCPICRKDYQEKLKAYYAPQLDSMCEDCQGRFQKNPLRMLDCKQTHCHNLALSAPKLLDYLCVDCQEHFGGVRQYLDLMEIPYEIDSGIVRGLDYYTRTVFEFVSEHVGTQGTICGGGRYDGLVETMGGAKTPGAGFAMGVERFLMEMEAQGILTEEPSPIKLYIAPMDQISRERAAQLVFSLRKAGYGCETDLMNRSFKAQLKYADKSKIPYLLVLGENETKSGSAQVKRMDDGAKFDVILDNLESFFTALAT